MNFKEMNTKDLLKLFQKERAKFEKMKVKEKELGGGSYFSSLACMNRKKLDTLYKKMDLLRSLTNEMYAELKMRGVEC
ncbi:MAG: hypothetical protein DLD55_01160 [candidate division SR1 bacterium]|jgi:hypothetical protein|nr:MAG: hypothetical protein DLD55_01160 [candidate division SR1 bacterium]